MRAVGCHTEVQNFTFFLSLGTGHYDPGRLWHAGSQDTDLPCHVPISIFLVHYMITIQQHYGQTDERQAHSKNEA